MSELDLRTPPASFAFVAASAALVFGLLPCAASACATDMRLASGALVCDANRVIELCCAEAPSIPDGIAIAIDMRRARGCVTMPAGAEEEDEAEAEDEAEDEVEVNAASLRK